MNAFIWRILDDVDSYQRQVSIALRSHESHKANANAVNGGRRPMKIPRTSQQNNIKLKQMHIPSRCNRYC